MITDVASAPDTTTSLITGNRFLVQFKNTFGHYEAQFLVGGY